MKFSRQPLVWLNVVGLLIGLAATFGFSLSKEQTVALMATLQAIATAVGWTQVTPVNAPNLPDAPWPPSAGHPPTP